MSLGLLFEICQSEDCQYIGVTDSTGQYNAITNSDGYRTDNLPEISRVQTIAEDANTNLTLNDTFFTLSSPQTDYYVWYDTGGAGTDPLVAGRTGIQVTVAAAATATVVATTTAAAITAVADFTATSVADLVTIENTQTGNVTNIADNTDAAWDTEFTFSILQQGAWFEVGLADATIGVNSDVTHAMVEFELPGVTYVHQTFEGDATAVDATTDQITLASHGMVTGDQVSLESENSPATLPTGLSENIIYYVIRVDDNTFSLATSALNATIGTAVNITAVGTDTVTIKENVIDVVSVLPNLIGTPAMLNSTALDYATSTSLPNGRYRFTYTIVGNGGGTAFVHTVTSEFSLICQAKCCVYARLAAIPDENCVCVDDEIDTALTAWTYLQALKHAAQCGHADRVDNLTDIIQALCDKKDCGICN